MTDVYSATRPLPSYREFARAIRAFAPTLGYPEARNELLSLAAHYEKLAGFVEAVASLAPTDNAETHAALSPAATQKTCR